MIILKDTKRASENIRHPFMIQTLSKPETEGNFLSLKKDLYGQPKNHTSWGNTELPPIQEIRQGYPLSHFYLTVYQRC